jgi:hypothetical protein
MPPSLRSPAPSTSLRPIPRRGSRHRIYPRGSRASGRCWLRWTPNWPASAQAMNARTASAVSDCGIDARLGTGGERLAWLPPQPGTRPGHKPQALQHRFSRLSRSEPDQPHAPNGPGRTGPRRRYPRDGSTRPVRGPVLGGQFPARPGPMGTASGGGEAPAHLPGGAGPRTRHRSWQPRSRSRTTRTVFSYPTRKTAATLGQYNTPGRAARLGLWPANQPGTTSISTVAATSGCSRTLT